MDELNTNTCILNKETSNSTETTGKRKRKSSKNFEDFQYDEEQLLEDNNSETYAPVEKPRTKGRKNKNSEGIMPTFSVATTIKVIQTDNIVEIFENTQIEKHTKNVKKCSTTEGILSLFTYSTILKVTKLDNIDESTTNLNLKQPRVKKSKPPPVKKIRGSLLNPPPPPVKIIKTRKVYHCYYF
jgi:hypothetical protein